MKDKFIKSGLLAILWLMTIPVLAGPVDPPGEDDPFPPDDPSPINQWEFILIFAAIALAVYFVVRHQRKAIV